MKRVMVLLVVAFAVTAQPAFAQGGRMQIGVTAGAAMSTFVGDDIDDADWRTAPYFGGALVFHNPGSLIGFETGLLYTSKGASSSEDGVDIDFKLAYVEVPLLLRLAFGAPGAQIRPVVTLGGSVGFKSSCKVEGSEGGVTVEFDCDEFGNLADFDVDAESVDFGVTGGIGLDIPVGARTVVAPHVRYTRGLTDVFSDVSAKNSSFQLGVSVRFIM